MANDRTVPTKQNEGIGYNNQKEGFREESELRSTPIHKEGLNSDSLDTTGKVGYDKSTSRNMEEDSRLESR